MEYVGGQVLKDRLEEGSIPLPKALSIPSEIAEALEKAQTRGIVHRDLKPSNIMITAEGHPKILELRPSGWLPSKEWTVKIRQSPTRPEWRAQRSWPHSRKKLLPRDV